MRTCLQSHRHPFFVAATCVVFATALPCLSYLTCGSCFSFNRQHLHLSGVDVPFGEFTDEEIEKAESIPPNSDLCSKTPLLDQLGPGPTEDILTIVVDFNESFQPTTSDIFGNNVSTFNVASYGFSQNQVELVKAAIMEKIQDDYFQELVGTPASEGGTELSLNLIEGDIGIPPAGITEYYFVQVGTGLVGPHTAFLGVAGSSVVRNSAGLGPNSGIDVGDVVGSVFTDEIRQLCCLSPFNALSSGNLEFTANAIAGTLSHEIAHTLSLSHINSAMSIQPTSGAAPIMGTGAIDLVNQQRITNREFSLVGLNGQADGETVFQIDQLVGSVGLTSNELLAAVQNGMLTVIGSRGNDSITVTPGSDAGEVVLDGNGIVTTFAGVSSIEIFGDEGDDTIIVNGSIPSELYGCRGDDFILGSSGPDLIHGGLGEDNLNGRNGADIIYGSAPGMADTFGNTIQGGRGQDAIVGTDFADIIFGGEANDTIVAFDGDDEIFGGQGADVIHAGFGDDTIRAGESNDEVFGGPGDDLILGGLGLDVLWGGNGNDTIFGGVGKDELRGGAGDDILNGNKNNDVLIGSSGNDTLTGGLANDLLDGGSGIDTATDVGEFGELNIE